MHSESIAAIGGPDPLTLTASRPLRTRIRRKQTQLVIRRIFAPNPDRCARALVLLLAGRPAAATGGHARPSLGQAGPDGQGASR